jgi:cobalt-zinc-cadmium efflux system outer membrane protein
MRAAALVLAPALLLSGCALRPAGERAERKRIEDAGAGYLGRVEPPPLPQKPGPEDYLRHAFLRNSELEARYWEWRQAIERVPQVSSPPNAAVPFSYLFSAGQMKAWDRTTLGISNDPMTNIPFPSKLATAGRKALEEARAAGRRFEEAKFRLQGEVLSNYYELALHGELFRIQEENVALLRLVVGQAAARVQGGLATQADLLKAQTELDLAENDLVTLHAQLPSLEAKMDALLGRPLGAPVPIPESLPPPRPLEVADAQLIRVGSERSPELQALAHEVEGREEALSLARQAYIPDLNLSFSFTGSVSQTVGGMLVLPTRLEAIRAGVEEARAGLRAARATRAHYERNLAASFVLNLYLLRNSERQAALFEGTILPRARQTVEIAQSGYAAGRLGFADLLESQRTLLNVRVAVAELKMEREKTLAAIETWSAVDLEVLHAVTSGRGGSMGGARP